MFTRRDFNWGSTGYDLSQPLQGFASKTPSEVATERYEPSMSSCNHIKKQWYAVREKSWARWRPRRYVVNSTLAQRNCTPVVDQSCLFHCPRHSSSCEVRDRRGERKTQVFLKDNAKTQRQKKVQNSPNPEQEQVESQQANDCRNQSPAICRLVWKSSVNE